MDLVFCILLLLHRVLTSHCVRVFSYSVPGVAPGENPHDAMNFEELHHGPRYFSRTALTRGRDTEYDSDFGISYYSLNKPYLADTQWGTDGDGKVTSWPCVFGSDRNTMA
jgi:hypothetical protein